MFRPGEDQIFAVKCATTFAAALDVPQVVKADPQVSGIILSIPDQQLLSRANGFAAAIHNPASVLKRHQVLLLAITSTVHIPEGERDTGATTCTINKIKLLVKHSPDIKLNHWHYKNRKRTVESRGLEGTILDSEMTPLLLHFLRQ